MKNISCGLWHTIAIPKLDLKMKISLFLLIASFLNVTASSYSQNTKITLNLDDVVIKEVFSEISNKTDFKFLYSEKDFDVNRKVSVNVEKEQIESILDLLFSETSIRYQIVDNQVVLSKNEFTAAVVAPAKSSAILQELISGVVTDDSRMPLPGVSIKIVGTSRGADTDFDGNFSIQASEGDVLEFSYVGMKTQLITIETSKTLNLVMIADENILDEVVIVGYGTQKKKSLTAAVSQIESAEIQTTTATSLAQKLQGKVAGLNIRQTDGAPGFFRNSINIRGFGEPIYVIDGVLRGGSADFQRLSSSDIESISVLKDASAAIYGLNAANGVIIVTTKKGKKGKANFTYNGSYGVSTPTDIPVMANAAQYSTLRNEANLNAGLSPLYSEEQLALWNSSEFKSTDWSKETLLNSSHRQQHDISASGGSDDVSYYFNLGFMQDNGLLKSGDINYTKFNFRSNVSAKVTKNITATFNIAAFTDKRESPIWNMFNIWRGTVSSLPINPAYANNNTDYLHRVQDGQAMNPVAIAQSDLTGYARNEDNVFQTAFDVNYEVPYVKGLELKAKVSYDPRFAQAKSLAKDFVLYDYDIENETYDETAFNKPAWIRNDYNNSKLLTLQAQANYKTTIADNHNVAGLLVFEQREQTGRAAFIRKFYDFFTNDQIDQATDTNAESGGNEVTIRNMSYIGKLNYDYKGKYLLELIARYDGSYRYHPDVRWGLFPSISGGWRISDEAFMQDISWLSNLKLRASFGVVGQDAGAPFQYIPAFSTTGGGTYEFDEGMLTNGAATPSIVNEELTWMESKIVDFGIELGLFKHTLNITADVYQRDRTGLLAYRNVTIPNTFGGTLPQENLNSDRVQGIEFSATYNNNIGEFKYNISGNYNLARTMNVYIESAPFTSSWSQYRSGASNRWNDMVWQYNVLGQFQNSEEILTAPIQGGTTGNSLELPGDFRYEDLNGDGVIDGNDQRPNAYNETPKSNFGLTLAGQWRGFDFSMLFQGAANFTARYTHAYSTMFWGEGNLPAYFEDRWHKADYSDQNSAWVPGKWPALRVGSDQAPQLYAASDVWRRDASYVRLKNIELGYTLDNNGLRKAGISSVRIYSNASNVYTWADEFIKPFDPEKVADSNSQGTSAGWSYPILRTVNFGVNLKF